MSQKNTGAFTQFPRNYGVNITTLNGGSLTVPTNTGLLAVAGPDGMDIWALAAMATATQTSANNLEFFVSKDFGATFAALPITGAFTAGATAPTALNIGMPNTVPAGPTNPLVLGGVPGPFTHTMAQSSLSETASWYSGYAPTGGSANAQTLAVCFNTSGTQAASALAVSRIFDFVAGFTNSGALTLQLGLAGAGTAVTTPAGAALTGAEVTKGFRYRVVDTGAAYILLPSDRLYVAMTQSQACTVTAWGADR